MSGAVTFLPRLLVALVVIAVAFVVRAALVTRAR